jgi:hypothetical protein
MEKKYDEVSPITNNLCVLVDRDDSTGLTSKLCVESGFTTNSFLKDGSKTLEELRTMIPKVAYDLKVVDKDGNIWIPAMQSTEFSSIYPIPNQESEDGFLWQVTPIKKLSEEDSKKYPNPDKPGEFMTSYVDFENSKNFPQDSFTDALEYFVNMDGND